MTAFFKPRHLLAAAFLAAAIAAGPPARCQDAGSPGAPNNASVHNAYVEVANFTLRNNVIRKTDDLPVNSQDFIITGFDVYGDIKTVRTVDISNNTFVISASRQRNWSFNVIDLIPRPQVIEWNNNVFLRHVEGEGATLAATVAPAEFTGFAAAGGREAGAAGGGGAGREKPAAPQRREVTIKGNVLCNRATIPVFWDQTSQDSDHFPVVYAFEGTPEISAELNTIMDEYYPRKGLDVEAAQRFMDEFTRRLRYDVAPGPLVAKIHKEVEWGSQILALTGVLSLKNGRKWIDVSRYEATEMAYPPRMLEPDRPFVTPEGAPLVLVAEGLTLKCVPIPAGRFLQGSPFYQQRYQDEYPHEVALTRPFYMSETPVTQEMFEALVGKNPSANKGPRFPVERAAWPDIVEFCRILSEKSGRTVRLPTDAEWEYAARVGTSNPCFTPKYADQISEAGVKGNARPVKTAKPNAWGLYDMLCGGWHITSSYKADNARAGEIDPQGPPRGDRSIQRNEAGPMHKSRGGYHYSFIRPNMHGALGEDGSIWEGGVPIFRVVIEYEPPPLLGAP